MLATQNPIESEGVYPLPEAQRDRFLMKIVDRLPDRRRGGRDRPPDGRATRRRPRQVARRSSDLIRLQAAADEVYVDRAVVDYAVTLVLATRYPANYALVRHRAADRLRRQPPRQPRPGRRRPGARPAAGPRPTSLPQDVFDVAPDVLRHRLVLSYEALAQGVAADQVLGPGAVDGARAAGRPVPGPDAGGRPRPQPLARPSPAPAAAAAARRPAAPADRRPPSGAPAAPTGAVGPDASAPPTATGTGA